MRALVLALVLTASPAQAHGPEVREARQWLRDKTHDRGFRCFHRLWERESGWSPRAHNPVTGAHGIPQAVPGWKMGKGWRTDAMVQVRWGYRYVVARYRTSCRALRHQTARGWY